MTEVLTRSVKRKEKENIQRQRCVAIVECFSFIWAIGMAYDKRYKSMVAG